jgi:hypothetical protein
MTRPVRSPFLATIAVLSLTFLVACAAEVPEVPVATTAPEPSFTPAYVAPPEFDLAPLTGEKIEVGGLASPSLAAKIDNHPAARPQIGLDRADIVFEELVEGGMTR